MTVSEYFRVLATMPNIYQYITPERFDTTNNPPKGHPQDSKGI